MNAGLASEATLVLVVESGDSDAAEHEAARLIGEDRESRFPALAVVRGSATQLGVVRVLPFAGGEDSQALADELARRVARLPGIVITTLDPAQQLE
jgi:hypothetical protein